MQGFDDIMFPFLTGLLLGFRPLLARRPLLSREGEGAGAGGGDVLDTYFLGCVSL